MSFRRSLLMAVSLAVAGASVAIPAFAGGVPWRAGAPTLAAPAMPSGPLESGQAAYDGLVVLRSGCHTGYLLDNDVRVSPLEECLDIRTRVDANARRWVSG